MTHAAASRRELAFVAVVLLLPIPLFAASGLRIPLPAAIERGVASLIPGGQFGAAVVEGAPARPEPGVPSGSEGDGTATAETQATSSTGISPGASDVPARSDERQAPTRGDADSPTPDTGGEAPPSDGGGGPGGDTGGDTGGGTGVEVPAPVEVSASFVEPSESGAAADLTIDVDAAGASAEITVTDDGVGVTTGGSIDAVPDVPVSPPALPIP